MFGNVEIWAGNWQAVKDGELIVYTVHDLAKVLCVHESALHPLGLEHIHATYYWTTVVKCIHTQQYLETQEEAIRHLISRTGQ